MLVMFWTGTIFYAHASALSTSVFFLIWDRCFTLIWPIWYNHDKRHKFCLMNIVTQLTCYSIIVIWEMQGMPGSNVYSSKFLMKKWKFNEFSDCMSYGCASPTTAYKITYMKVFHAVLNACSAGIFLFTFLRYNRLRHKSKRSNFNVSFKSDNKNGTNF